MSTAALTTTSDRAAELTDWAERQAAALRLVQPPPVTHAFQGVSVSVHGVAPSVFDALRCAGRDGWTFNAQDGTEWLRYEAGRASVVLFRA